VNDVTTAEYFSRRAGKQEIQKTSISGGVSNVYVPNQPFPIQATSNQNSNINLVLEDNLSVTNLYSANPNSLFLFYSGQAMPTICQKLQYDEDELFKERFDMNPMHTGK
jgi:type IV secretory pathway TraG/TraD family ATPase VirD4